MTQESSDPKKSPKKAGKKVIAPKEAKAEPLKAAPVVLPTLKGAQTVVLDSLGVEGLCALIEEGHSISAIARSLGMEPSTVTRWIGADAQRSARVRESRVLSAEAFADRAEEVLMEATTAVEVARARELASHYRWKAKVRNPKEFGDKVQVDTDIKVSDLTDEQLDSRIATFLRASAGTAAAAAGSAAAVRPEPHV